MGIFEASGHGWPAHRGEDAVARRGADSREPTPDSRAATRDEYD